MMLTISSLSVGCRNIVLPLLFERSEKCLCEYFVLFCGFSYRGKVIIKDFCKNPLCTTVIKGGYTDTPGCYSFSRNKGFDFFSCSLNIIPIFFKIFIIISLFTFRYKGGE